MPKQNIHFPKNQPPPAGEYRKLRTRVVNLHPMTVIQNAGTSGGGYVAGVPTQACSVGPCCEGLLWLSDRHY